jgi:FkbM family methyltransferase
MSIQKYNFNQHGVEFEFLHDENLTIPSFQWYMDVLSSGVWESDTFEVFKKVKNKNKIAIDIGGWIGSTSIWLAKNFDHVIVVEADKNALVAMKNNFIRNKCYNITIVEKAIHNIDKTNVIFGINEHLNQGLGDSVSQVKNEKKYSEDYEVGTITLNSLIDGYDKEKILFVKVDIEGGEENILNDLIELGVRYKWKIWISFHFHWWENKNIQRFHSSLQKIPKIYLNNTLISVEDFYNSLMVNPLNSYYFEFQKKQ